jgi:hypothetical protein
MRQTAGKIPASQAATQVAEVKKRRGKRTRSVVSADTTTRSSDVKTTNVEGRGRHAVAEGNNGFVAGKAGSGDAPPDAWGAGVIHIEHQPSRRCWVEQEVEEGPAQALQAES